MDQAAERRLFFAALLDQASREALLAATARYPEDQRLRWLAPEGWHLTLRFVGNVAPALVAPLDAAFKASARLHAPSVLTLKQLEPFPSAARPLVIAATGAADSAINSLVMDLEQRCQALGLAAVKQTFSAHVSLARVRGRGMFSGGVVPLEAAMPVRQIALMESVATKQGRRYVSLDTAELVGSSG